MSQPKFGKRGFKSKRKAVPVVIAREGDRKLWNANQPAPRSTIDYKNTKLLIKFISPQGKILPRRLTGTSLKYQRKVSVAVKRARHLALMPYVADMLK